ncbi:MAG: hypothetical protein A2W90_00300 [Bacteroidetes bacterium GWF2_42_66]|nr:MAG: hypothetical protein A2W92_09480 [Bacteroidetes bacterium GWA2_42_15]OFX97857.1 MAG: hypothetical protein A2W89_07285 [Bacteroidetes bacterium GWE2_42_39]OFY44166.1 MAG: hypothetical protein A2W90_00300 [Bacteroidetes bacterium GWF2_42_66]HBL74586.1 hypothetical protein [Prolixibacteraceae bacterium]HCR91526.1 hypothetical protein [Prolixibacteraceae bacterium]
MKKYFIVENNQQTGPLSIDELRMKGISPSTLIWFEGMANWEQAATIGELNELFAAPPPPPPYHQNVPPPASHQQSARQPASSYRPLPDTGNAEGNLVAAAYLLAVLGGVGGIITGAMLWMGKETVNGGRYKKYTPTGQLHGAFAFFLGIIVWAVCVDLFLKG